MASFNRTHEQHHSLQLALLQPHAQWTNFLPFFPQQQAPPASRPSRPYSSAAGLLGPAWCYTCNTSHHTTATCSHKFPGPDSIPPFAGV
ncbi:hypothetical protein FF1_002807 [Malus domestica]